MKNQKLLTNIEGEVQELTEEDFISAVPFSTLPETLKNKLAALDAQQVAIKESLTLQLSQDVVQKFQATGMQSSDKEDYEAKEKAFYNAMISAWLNTRLERDKQLLGLSVTAIGLLVTLLRTVGVSNYSQVVFFGLALLAFMITVFSVIYILGENSTHIEKVLENSETESKFLTCLDKAAGISFILGMLLVIIIGIQSAAINLNEKVISMNQEKSSETQLQSVTNKESWSGVAKLRPQPPKDSPTTPNSENPSATSEGGNGSSAGQSGSGS
jgi:uncharacterized protein (DUF4415 family)